MIGWCLCFSGAYRECVMEVYDVFCMFVECEGGVVMRGVIWFCVFFVLTVMVLMMYVFFFVCF